MPYWQVKIMGFSFPTNTSYVLHGVITSKLEFSPFAFSQVLNPPLPPLRVHNISNQSCLFLSILLFSSSFFAHMYPIPILSMQKQKKGRKILLCTWFLTNPVCPFGPKGRKIHGCLCLARNASGRVPSTDLSLLLGTDMIMCLDPPQLCFINTCCRGSYCISASHFHQISCLWLLCLTLLLILFSRQKHNHKSYHVLVGVFTQLKDWREKWK